MTERMIEHWAFIAKAVFTAEDAISDEWFPKLRATKDAPKEERERIVAESIGNISGSCDGCM